MLSPDLTILGANNRYLAVTTRELDEIVGKHFLLEAFPEPSVSYEQNPVRLSIEKAVQAREKVYLDAIRYAIARPDGTFEERFWEASHTPIHNEQGELAYILQETKDVTERESARAALLESERKFKFMADSMPQLIDADDASGNSTYFNKQWEVYTGISVAQLLAGEWENAIHPDDLPLARQAWRTSLEKGEESQAEIRIRNKEGDYRWHLNRYLPMRDEDGSTKMWIGSSTDLHDIKQLVQELLLTNEQMSELADQVQLAYKKAEAERYNLERLIMQAPTFFAILRSPEHRYEMINNKYQALFPHLNLIGKTVAEALPEVKDQGFVKILDDVYSKGEAFEADEIIVKLANAAGVLEDNYLTFNFQPLFDERDEVNGILIVGYNVTDKFRMKQKLQELGIKTEELI